MNDTKENLKVYLLCRYAADNSLYTSWIDALPMPTVIVEDCSADFHPPADCGLVVTHEHYRWEEISALRRIYEQQSVPVLILADGVLEYRNTWDNPTIPSASIYQPLMGHKIACVGNSSARIIEAWGNEGKVEIVGLPRLDSLLSQSAPSPSAPLKVLITTATTPAFTDQQRELVIQSIGNLKSAFEAGISFQGENVQAVWRLTDGLYDAAEITDPGEDQPALLDAIKDSNAVITTPSTIYFESALLKRPTAVLDYSNSPPMTQTAWSITNANQIESTVSELLNPPGAKTWYQDYCLRDSLACQSPATPRIVELIVQMVNIAAEQRKQQLPVSFPNPILPALESSKSNYRAAAVYDDLQNFSDQEIERLQLELSEAIHRLGTVPRELADKNNQINALQAALDESRRRVADVRARLFKLRKILGIGKENKTED